MRVVLEVAVVLASVEEAAVAAAAAEALPGVLSRLEKGNVKGMVDSAVQCRDADADGDLR